MFQLDRRSSDRAQRQLWPSPGGEGQGATGDGGWVHIRAWGGADGAPSPVGPSRCPRSPREPRLLSRRRGTSAASGLLWLPGEHSCIFFFFFPFLAGFAFYGMENAPWRSGCKPAGGAARCPAAGSPHRPALPAISSAISSGAPGWKPHPSPRGPAPSLLFPPQHEARLGATVLFTE